MGSIASLERHTGPAAFELNVDGLPEDAEQFSAYMATLDQRQLDRLEEALKVEFTRTMGDDDGASLDGGGVVKLKRLSVQVKAVKAEGETRRRNAASDAATAAAEAQKAALAELKDTVFGDKSGTKEGEDTDEDGDDGDDATDAEELKDDSPVEVTAAALVKAVRSLVRKTVPVEAVIAAGGPDLNRHVRGISLSDVSRHSPASKAPEPRREAVIVASSGLPGIQPHGRIETFAELVRQMSARARMLPVTRNDPNYVPVASLQRDFRFRLSLDSTPDEVNEVLTAALDVQALVAAGGWCAPSEISYDFFNIVAEDGMLDLPSVGILNRGGFRFPVSPTIADIFGTAGALWSWTETQDQAAVTGTAQSGVKTCARVPCPDFDEVRAACDGLCVTVGNLIDFAYPELISNHIRLVMAARAHQTNAQVIQRLVTESTLVTYTDPGEGGAAADVLAGLDLFGTHYRERFRMAEGSILEAVLPRWAIGPIRADLSRRNGLALMDVSMSMVADWLNERSIRAQFVSDWQLTSIGHPTVNPTAFPTEVNALLYAPGTFVRGQGLQLDLGVVRDSTLNETNDHTAAWMEDCYAVAKVGHESFNIPLPICNGGQTGANDITCAA